MRNQIQVENITTYGKSRIHTFTTYIFQNETLVKMISESRDQNGREDYREQTHSFGHWLANVTPEEFLKDRGIDAKIIIE